MNGDRSGCYMGSEDVEAGLSRTTDGEDVGYPRASDAHAAHGTLLCI